ncbi:hypothetical protein BU17DRAFT_103390 [Hysterangium stoloniferum]|nr:hypothetical protein BU17DRAFT_103390 [Hysterangium stoloniferum]
MAAWWNAGRTEFLKLEVWETFAKQIRSRFIAQGLQYGRPPYICFVCAQHGLPFLQYAADLADARNALGPIVITAAIYKYQLLFHAHPRLLFRIMTIPDFDLENISFDNLVALMSIKWESLVMEALEAACKVKCRSLLRRPQYDTHEEPTAILGENQGALLLNLHGAA